MRAIEFHCSRVIPGSGTIICAAIANPESWSAFKGYGILPGIARAEYETQTDVMIGSRIRVVNTDGSTYVEEITQWVMGEKVAMTFHHFSPPLSRLASHFTEEWTLTADHGATYVRRAFQLFPRREMTRPMLWLISLLFRRAIARNLAEIAAAAEPKK